MAVIDKARELGIALLDSPEFRELRAARAAIEADVSLHETVVAFIKNQLSIKKMTEEGSSDPESLTSLIAEVDRIRGQLEQNESFERFITAQEQFSQLMDDVNQEVNRCIGAPTDDLAELEWLN